jgi:hypothetical protein
VVWCFGDPKETEAASTLRVVEAKFARPNQFGARGAPAWRMVCKNCSIRRQETELWT